MVLARYARYVGVDVSETAVELCKQRFAGDACKKFFHLEFYRGEGAEMALSLDVVPRRGRCIRAVYAHAFWGRGAFCGHLLVRCARRCCTNFGARALDVVVIRYNYNFANTQIPMIGQQHPSDIHLDVDSDVLIGIREIILPGCRRVGSGYINHRRGSCCY